MECIRGAYLLGTTLLANAPAMRSDKDKEEPSSRSKYPPGHDVYGATSFVVTRCTASKPLIASVRRMVGRASTCSLLSQELDAVDENQMDRIAQGKCKLLEVFAVGDKKRQAGEVLGKVPATFATFSCFCKRGNPSRMPRNPFYDTNLHGARVFFLVRSFILNSNSLLLVDLNLTTSLAFLRVRYL